MDRYSVTKLLNVFWVIELVSRLSGDEVVINMINPGSVDTGLHRDGDMGVKLFDKFIGRTPEKGGRLLIDAAVVKGEETHGKYLSEAKMVEYVSCL
jgi:retinol dehydrogenase-12